MNTKNGCFYITTLNVSVNPFQFSSSKILIKSKNKGFCYYSYFCPFFFGLGGAFFFLLPSFFFSYSSLFYYYFFLVRYSSSSLSLSSQLSFNFKFHLIITFLPSIEYYFIVFNLSRKRWYSLKENDDFCKNWFALMNSAFSSKFVNLFKIF